MTDSVKSVPAISVGYASNHRSAKVSTFGIWPILTPCSLTCAKLMTATVRRWRAFIGGRFKNDTERLERLFELYTKMSAGSGTKRKRKVSAA